jgi:hypothetical protein
MEKQQVSTSKIDWAALADEERDRAEKSEVRTDSGIVIVPFTSGSHLRSWVKFRGEPAFRLVETPAQFATRWMAFRNNPAQDVCIVHEHEYGQAVFLFREALDHLMYISVTYPDTSQGRTTPGSIWSGQCECWRYGGTCPKRDD